MSLKNRLFIIFQHCVPQHTLSRLIGLLADCRAPWLKNFLIQQFIKHFNVDMSEAEETHYRHYDTFNLFFTRKLKYNSRPICADQKTIASPADGAISEIGAIKKDQLLQAKNRSYQLSDLLGGDQELTEIFYDGNFATIYLSPKDYHRLHMPIDGTLKKTIYVPGKLFSVNQTTADNVENLFARNERLICIFDTNAGEMAIILVGAMIVASIETVWGGQITPQPKNITSQTFGKIIHLKKGDELGHFKLGSTAIVLFSKDTINWNSEYLNGKTIKLGHELGCLRT